MDSGVKPRVGWVDAAKGVAVLLVVLTHAYSYAKVIGADLSWWQLVNNVFSTMRMPLFFMLAGLFAPSWIRRSWAELLRGKVLLLMWVYAVWVLIRFAFFAAVPNLVAPNESAALWRLLIQAVWSSTPTWFLYALAVFFVGAKLLTSTPAWLQIGGSALVSVIFLADWITLPSSLWTGLAEYFVFFLLGVHGSQVIRRWAGSRIGRSVALASTPVWLAITTLAVSAGWWTFPGARFALALAALPAGVGLGIMLSRLRPLRYIGQHTMPVYLGHTLVQGGLAVWLTSFPQHVLDAWSWWLPLGLVAVSTLVSLVLYWAVRAAGVRGLYEPPRWVTRRLAPALPR